MLTYLKKFYNNSSYLPNERLWLFCMLIFIGGFLGGFTFTLKGKFFVNAQTGNMVLLSTGIGNFDTTIIKNTFTLLVVYFLGVMLAEYISKKIYKENYYIWERILLLISMAVCFLLGFIPDSASLEIFLYPIAFIVAMQFATFERAQGLGMATGFCTNHLKQTAANFTRYLKTKDIQKLIISLSHLSMIVCFIFGSSLAVFFANLYANKSIWIASFLFALTLIIFNRTIKNNRKLKNFNNRSIE